LSRTGRRSVTPRQSNDTCHLPGYVVNFTDHCRAGRGHAEQFGLLGDVAGSCTAGRSRYRDRVVERDILRCALVYDPGTLSADVAYTITVVHP